MKKHEWDKFHYAILFNRCTGLNDLDTLSTLKTDYQSGETDLSSCLNLTTTQDGAVQKKAALSLFYTHSEAITSLHAGSRLFFQDSTDTIELDGVTPTTRFASNTGALFSTPIDVRIAGATNYKSPNGTPTAVAATVGVNPNPEISTTYYAMPTFSDGFVFNAKLYGINAADTRFLQYSEDYHYDLFNLGDNHIGFKEGVLQASVIHPNRPGESGSILLLHTNGITLLNGTGPNDFIPRFFPCKPFNGSLASGHNGTEYVHNFICPDGIYAVDATGKIENITIDKTNTLNTINSSYVTAYFYNRQYVAIGNAKTIEYSYYTDALMLDETESITDVCKYGNDIYVAVGDSIYTLDSIQNGTCSFEMTLPFGDYGVSGSKLLEDLYFTGVADGDITITVTGSNGTTFDREICFDGTYSDYRIKLHRLSLGTRVELKISATSATSFRLERLEAKLHESMRVR